MKLSRVLWVAITVLAVAATLLLWGWREPRYDGRPLTSWLQQSYDTPLMETQRLAEAQIAIRAIGAKEALPRLMRLVKADDDPVSTWILGKSKDLRWSVPTWRSAEDWQQLGIAGFEALETNAAPALEKLTPMLDDPSHAFVAVRCLVSIGPAAEGALCKALTNASSQVRYFAASQFSWACNDDVRYVSILTNCLNDSDGGVRSAAIQGIGAQTQMPELVIPILVKMLAKRDGNVSGYAAQALAGFGTNAIAIFPELSNFVEHGDFDQTARQTMQSMVAITPEGALPVVLTNRYSADPRRRQAALRLLFDYPLTNADISVAIEQAAQDSDPKIAHYAQDFITKGYEREHPYGPGLTNEPNYAGKSLGAWLADHDRNGQFSEAATEALRKIGTNAIPALLARLVYVRPPFGAPARDVNMDALRGFITLGEQAIPALPQLFTLMDSTNQGLAQFAMMSACNTGSNAMPFFLKGLTNDFPDVRSEAIQNLTEGTGAQFPELRKQAVPLLIKLLNDPDEDVRQSVTNALKVLDPQAATKTGIK